MLKESLRILAIILLLVIIITDDFPFYDKMKNSTIQLFLAILVIIFIFYDTTFGFLIGLTLMLIYYEIYKKLKFIKKTNNGIQYEEISNKKNDNIIKSIKLDYITDEHLISAQNNIFDKNNFETEVIGVENIQLYGAQGLNKKPLFLMGYNSLDNLAPI